MKKTRKIIISIVASILVVGIGLLVYYNYFYDANKLNISEKEWLNNNKTTVVSFNTPNDLNVFAKSGKGVFYDFLGYLEKKTEININKNIISIGSEKGLGFVVNKKIDSDDLLIYKDHFVIIGKEYVNVNTITNLNGKNIGGLSDYISRITANYKTNITFTTFENRSALLDALEDDKVDFLIIPLNEYLDEIIANKYKVVYHLDSIINYYYLNLGSDKTLNSIITKYYNTWKNTKYEESYYSNTYDLFIQKLNISQIEIDNLTNKSYNYGFVNNTPFQTLSSSKYGGKIIAYLEEFSKFSNVDFTYTKFKSNNELIKSFEKKKTDLLFNNTSFSISGSNIQTNINAKYSIISPLKDAYKVSNISDLNNIEIYTLKDSNIAVKLSENKNIKLKLVNSEKELLKQIKKNKVVALYSETYDYLVNTKIKNYQVVYEGYLNNYSFKYQNSNDTFYKLFSNYLNYLSDYDMSNEGFISFKVAESNGNLISRVAKYILLVIAFAIVVVAIIISSHKHIKLNTKRIKKDEKLKFVDMLTSLKNRNYLNERISTWNQNTIYPQAIIVIDLNNIKYLNDTFGSKEGDRQIMAAANILHQTQLDNTEIMRTDGNEFMVYLVGYNEKQVVNYLKKLVKEFNELPYEYGAAFGFSMIVDDLKLIDDAINEATIQMRENKGLENEKSEEQS